MKMKDVSYGKTVEFGQWGNNRPYSKEWYGFTAEPENEETDEQVMSRLMFKVDCLENERRNSFESEHFGTDKRDKALANTIIERLNRMIQDPEIRRDVQTLMNMRCAVSQKTSDHHSIQVREEGDVDTMSFLGLLNGLIGVQENGYGYVSAVVDGIELISFERSKPAKRLDALDSEKTE
jgi:hypothetical protein